MKLVFSRSNTAVGLAIRTATLSKWNHVDMVFDNNILIGAVGFHAGETWRGGVQQTTLSARLSQSNIAEYKIYDLHIWDEGAAFAFAQQQLGKPYDWSGVFGFLAPNRNWQQDDSWFCSELVAATALAGKTTMLNRAASRIVPGVLELSPFLLPISV